MCHGAGRPGIYNALCFSQAELVIATVLIAIAGIGIAWYVHRAHSRPEVDS